MDDGTRKMTDLTKDWKDKVQMNVLTNGGLIGLWLSATYTKIRSY